MDKTCASSPGHGRDPGTVLRLFRLPGLGGGTGCCVVVSSSPTYLSTPDLGTIPDGIQEELLLVSM